jgi:hypothetical protein
MENANTYSVVCTEMGPHQASLRYTGTMCQGGALALEFQFDRLFGYYKYRRVTLMMESPGGTIDGMDYVLRVMQRWAVQGRAVAIGSTFQCASAAAFLLSMGEWGRRRVDRSTFLLFHSARLQSASFAEMTAALSINLSQALNSVDKKLLDVMVDKMLLETGSPQDLAQLVGARLRHVDLHWKTLAVGLTTFTTAFDDKRRPDWLKDIQKWARPAGDPAKFVLELKKHLSRRLQRDVRMDLCEAYVLCLIDEVVDVLMPNSPESLSPRGERVRETLPEDASTLVQVCMTSPLDSMAPSA